VRTLTNGQRVPAEALELASKLFILLSIIKSVTDERGKQTRSHELGENRGKIDTYAGPNEKH